MYNIHKHRIVSQKKNAYLPTHPQKGRVGKRSTNIFLIEASNAKFKSPCNFEESPAYFLHLSFMKMSISWRVYWNPSCPLLIILKVNFLESNLLRFIETLISFIRGFVYYLYMPGLK